MAMLDRTDNDTAGSASFPELCRSRWQGEVVATLDEAGRACRVECGPAHLRDLCQWLTRDLDFALATLVVEQGPPTGWSLLYAFYRDANSPWVHVELKLDAAESVVPSVVDLFHGPSFDWHEREVEDLFGLHFEDHPRLGEFVLHEDWPEGINPMRRDFDARKRFEPRTMEPKWEPPTIVMAPGAFAMPIGPVFSDFAEFGPFFARKRGRGCDPHNPAFLLQIPWCREDCGRTTGRPRLAARRALFRDRRFRSWPGILPGRRGDLRRSKLSPRALALRTVFAELERLRSHAAAITGICNSTALAVATSQAALIEEEPAALEL